MFERYTESARIALFNARGALTEHGGTRINDVHLLLGLLQTAGDELLGGIATAQTTQELSTHLVSTIAGPERLDTSVEVPFDERTQRILKDAATLADRLKHQDITPRHLFLSLLRESHGDAVDCLQRAGISVDVAIAAIFEALRRSGTR